MPSRNLSTPSCPCGFTEIVRICEADLRVDDAQQRRDYSAKLFLAPMHGEDGRRIAVATDASTARLRPCVPNSAHLTTSEHHDAAK